MTSQKEKRGAIGARRRRDLSLFAAKLESLKPEFPRINFDIQCMIEDVLTEAARTREGDRQLVLDTLAQWGPLKRDELIDETGLKERIMRGILTELLQSGVITVADRPGDTERGGRPAKVYSLAQTV